MLSKLKLKPGVSRRDSHEDALIGYELVVVVAVVVVAMLEIVIVKIIRVFRKRLRVKGRAVSGKQKRDCIL